MERALAEKLTAIAEAKTQQLASQRSITQWVINTNQPQPMQSNDLMVMVTNLELFVASILGIELKRNEWFDAWR